MGSKQVTRLMLSKNFVPPISSNSNRCFLIVVWKNEIVSCRVPFACCVYQCRRMREQARQWPESSPNYKSKEHQTCILAIYDCKNNISKCVQCPREWQAKKDHRNIDELQTSCVALVVGGGARQRERTIRAFRDIFGNPVEASTCSAYELHKLKIYHMLFIIATKIKGSLFCPGPRGKPRVSSAFTDNFQSPLATYTAYTDLKRDSGRSKYLLFWRTSKYACVWCVKRTR